MSGAIREFDPASGDLAVGEVGFLRAFNESGLITSADVQVARRLSKLSDETAADEVLLAAALAVRAVRTGSICVALETIADLPAGTQFDMAFIDADKTNYANYFEALLPLIRTGGVILVDNTLWSRRVLDPKEQDADTAALGAFNKRVAADDRVRCVIIPMGDGVTLLQKL